MSDADGASSTSPSPSDSALLLYGLTGAALSLPDMAIHGVGGAQLHLIVEGGLAALVSAVPPRSSVASPQVEDLLAFQRAIAAVHAVADVLPARFGSVLESEPELRSHLHARQAPYLEALARIAGCVELAVRIPLASSQPPEPAAAAPRPSGGADYLRARQAHHKRLQQAQEQVQRSSAAVVALFADLARASHTQPSSDNTAISVSFLVPRAHVEELRHRFAAQLGSATPRQFLLGPWPPFSFADANAGPTVEDRTGVAGDAGSNG